MTVTPAIACGFWVAGAFFGSATIRERLLWPGRSLFAPSVLVFVCGIIALIPLAAGWTWDGIRPVRFGSVVFSAECSAAVFEDARHAAGGIAIGVSIGLVVWAMTLGNESKKEGA